ncbi:DUF732 domain-containing protein [Mycolicibacterium phlei]
MIRLVALCAATALLCAAPVGAEERDYLDGLQDRYGFLSTQQLVSEGYRVCAVTDAGALAPDAVAMVIDDLGIGMAPAMDIVSDAILELC